MRKKFIAVYALMAVLALGSTTLTSCVDDNESASVTAIRDAKAAQLNASANLLNAQAESEKVIAEAEAALKNAKAEWQKEQTEEAKQKFAIQIEVIRAQAEESLAYYKLQVKKYEQDLLEYADDHLRELYDEYQGALNNIQSNQNEKIRLTTEIAKAEAGLESYETIRDNNIARLDREIAFQEYKISLYEQYEGADLVTLKQEQEKARQEAKKAEDTQSKKQAAYDEANEAYTEESYRFNYNNSVTEPLDIVEAAKELNNKWSGTIKWGSKELDKEHFVNYYTLNAEVTERTKQSLEGGVKYWTDQLDEKNTFSLTAQLAQVKKDRENALKADPDADVSYYDNQIALLNAKITDAKTDLASAEETLKSFNTLVAKFNSDSKEWKAYTDAIAALTKLAENATTANKDLTTAQENTRKAWDKYTVASDLVNQEDVTAQIENCQNLIAGYIQEKEGFKNNVIDQETAIATLKQELENVEAQLVAQQAIIDNLQKLIDAAIAAQGEE